MLGLFLQQGQGTFVVGATEGPGPMPAQGQQGLPGRHAVASHFRVACRLSAPHLHRSRRLCSLEQLLKGHVFLAGPAQLGGQASECPGHGRQDEATQDAQAHVVTEGVGRDGEKYHKWTGKHVDLDCAEGPDSIRSHA